MNRSTSKSARRKRSGAITVGSGRFTHKLKPTRDSWRLSSASMKLVTELRDHIYEKISDRSVHDKYVVDIVTSPDFARVIDLFPQILVDMPITPDGRSTLRWLTLMKLVKKQDALIFWMENEAFPFSEEHGKLKDDDTYQAAARFIAEHLKAKLIVPRDILKRVEDRFHAKEDDDDISPFESMYQGVPLKKDANGDYVVANDVVNRMVEYLLFKARD
jgi:hypothetical protein